MFKLDPKIWNSPVIRGRLLAEADFECNHGKPSKAQYWFAVPINDSARDHSVLKNYAPGVYDADPHEMQMAFAIELRHRLQYNIAHDGCWIVGWTHPPATWETIRTDGDNVWGRLCMIWLDADGDPQFTAESDLPFVEMIGRGGYYYIDLAERAYQEWSAAFGHKALKHDFGIKEEQTTKEVLSSLK